MQAESIDAQRTTTEKNLSYSRFVAPEFQNSNDKVQLVLQFYYTILPLKIDHERIDRSFG